MKQKQSHKASFTLLKSSKIALAISLILGRSTLGIAAPTVGRVTSGSAHIIQSGDVTNINQSTSKASINWNSFGIARHETVNFNQPSVNSITLNRVTGNEASVINGALNATGQVWILNANGVLFGKNAKVNTSGLLATTKTLSDANFQKGNYHFKGDSTQSVINLGTIDIANSGYASLIANKVSNKGTIKAIKGTIHLVGANEVSINLNGNSLINLTVDKGVLDALVENSGSLYADAGEVYLTTNAVNELLRGVVNNTGIIEAQSLGDITGKIELFAHGGEVQVGGTLKAEDGFIETSGKDFTIYDNTNIQTGLWLIDPTNITIDSTLASTLQTQLSTGNALVTTTAAGADSGDINVNSSIAWSANTLTLHADNDININATLNATGAAGLALEYAQTTASGTYNVSAPVNLATTGSFSTKKGVDAVKNYTIINSLGLEGSTTATDLQGINGGLAGNYVLGSNINASATSGWNSGGGFAPIMNFSTNFTGTFDGLGHTISNLTISRSGTDYIGLFGHTSGATIQNVGLLNNIMLGNNYVGGLVGNAANSIITNSYTTGTARGAHVVGGLVGWSNNSIITKAYATGEVRGTATLGGLVGSADNSSTITNSYARGAVTGHNPGAETTHRIGGLVGEIFDSSTITNSYATGAVSADAGSAYVGGLVGKGSSSNIINSFFDTTTAGTIFSAGGTGLVTNYMKTTKRFFDAGWDFDIWGRDTNNVQNGGYLGLRSSNSFDFNTVVGLTVANQTKVYDGTANITTTLSKANIIDNTTFGTKNVGTQTFTSNLGDYGITYATGFTNANTEVLFYHSGSEIISKKDLTLSGISVDNKIYDGTTTATVNATLSGIISGDSVSIAATFDNKNVGTGKTVILNSFAGADGANYSTAQTTTANISQKALTLSGISADNKVYDRTATATVNATLGGLISGDNVVIASTFDTKDIGTGKTVTLNSLVGADGANYSTTLGQTTTADVTKKVLSFSVANKIYDGTTTATTAAMLSGVIAGDTVTGTTTASFNTKNAGTGKIVTLDSVTFAGTDANNYSIVSGQTTTADISQKALTLSGISADNKVYDRTTSATATATLNGVIAGDTVSNTIASTFDTKKIGTGKTVTLNSLTGVGTSNYSITAGQTTTADITPKALGFAVSDKVYDGTTEAATYPFVGTLQGTLIGVIGGDIVDYALIASFDTKNVGLGKTVTLDNGAVLGTDGSNYSIALGQTTTADITQKVLTLSGVTASNKVYDATTTATVSATLGGLISGDSVSIASTFDTKNVGVAKTVTLNSLAGTDGGNYSMTLGQTTTADVTQKALTLSGITASNKVYDGTTTATVSATLGGLISGDSVSIASTFDNKNVGTGKTVTLNSLAGTDGTNYSVTLGQTTTADVTQKALTLSGITASNKVYDGTNIATTTATLSGVITGDTVSSSLSSTFDSKNVGTGKTVTVGGTLSGLDAFNYSIASGQTTTADVTQKALTLSGITASNKVYDGTNIATTAATLTGLIAGDSVSIASTFDNKNVGTAKTVTLNSLAGTDGANYSVTLGQTTADITKKSLTLSSISADNKVYDATTTATVNATLGGLISGDSVSIASTFDNENVGVAKTVTLNSLAGTDGGNYSAVLGQTTLADITAVPVVVSTSPTIDGIIASITNKSDLKVKPQTQPIPPPVFKGNTKALALKPIDQPSVLIGMHELMALNHIGGDLKTLVYKDSPLVLINQGIHFPVGVEQQFFVPQNDKDL